MEDFCVSENGIYKSTGMKSEYGTACAMVLSKEAFIAAYEKYIAERSEEGKWVSTLCEGYHCSKCSKKAPWSCTRSFQYLSNYCPNCGAKMQKPSENGKDC